MSIRVYLNSDLTAVLFFALIFLFKICGIMCFCLFFLCNKTSCASAALAARALRVCLSRRDAPCIVESKQRVGAPPLATAARALCRQFAELAAALIPPRGHASQHTAKGGSRRV